MTQALDEAMRRADKAIYKLFMEDPKATATDIRKIALASLAADGWVLVPREATEDMLESVPDTKPGTKAGDMLRAAVMDIAGDTWKRMLAAAPKPGETP